MGESPKKHRHQWRERGNERRIVNEREDSERESDYEEKRAQNTCGGDDDERAERIKCDKQARNCEKEDKN
jgi:hypothetical protein